MNHCAVGVISVAPLPFPRFQVLRRLGNVGIDVFAECGSHFNPLLLTGAILCWIIFVQSILQTLKLYVRA